MIHHKLLRTLALAALVAALALGVAAGSHNALAASPGTATSALPISPSNVFWE